MPEALPCLAIFQTVASKFLSRPIFSRPQFFAQNPRYGSIDTHPCKVRKDGGSTSNKIAQTEIHSKAGPPAKKRKDGAPAKGRATRLNAAPATNKNQLTGYGYDAAGNLTTSGSTSYVHKTQKIA